jgi:hypothetical protein
MVKPTPQFRDRLFQALLGVPAFNVPDNRDLLVRRLPGGPVAAIGRSSAKAADLNNIIEAAAAMGQLANSGEWALVIVAQNALDLTRGTEPGQVLEILLGELETRSTKASLGTHPEIVIGRDERLPITFLTAGLAVSKSVAKVLVPRVIDGVQHESANGTGWLIAPGLLLTNHHVIEARDCNERPATDADVSAQAKLATARFGYDSEDATYSEFGASELICRDPRLDYALLRLEGTSRRPPARSVSEWGYLPILPDVPRLTKGDRLNIIQHPQSGPKQIAIRSNFYYGAPSTGSEPDRIRYLTDTAPGASGSPVFDDKWRVLAIHHAAVMVDESHYKGEVIKYNNQGISIAAILASLPEMIRQEIRAAQGRLVS